MRGLGVSLEVNGKGAWSTAAVFANVNLPHEPIGVVQRVFRVVCVSGIYQSIAGVAE